MKSATPYLTGAPEAPSRLSATTVRADIETDVRQSTFPDACPEYADLLTARSVSEFEYVAPLPIDGDSSLADKALLADLAENDRRLQLCRERLEGAEKLRDEGAAALARLPRPKSRAVVVLDILQMVAMAVVASICGASILAPTIEPRLNTFFATRMDDPDDLSFWVAHLVAGGFFFSLCLAHLALVYWKRGDVGRRAGLLAVLVDLGFATAWGLQRLDGPRDFAASVTLLEAVATAGYALTIIAYATELRRNEPKVGPYRLAEAALRDAAQRCTHAEREHERAEASRRDLLEHVATREAAVRRADERRKLIDLSSQAAYATAVSELAHAAAGNPSADAYTADIERELATQDSAAKSARKWKWPWQS